MSDLFCSDHSRQAGEHLFGSAKQIMVWFLLEFDGRWEREAFQDSLLAAPIRTHLQAALDTIPQSQVLLIRQQPRLAPEGTTLFVAVSRESDPVMYEFHLYDEEDWPTLDIPAIIGESPAYAAFRRTEPLFLTCAHGRRDKCCARQGVPVYEQMVQHAGAAVWQTSHVGGHRFAANVVALPHGITYGRMVPDRAAALIDSHRAGRLIPDHYRGRALYPKPAQAAEYFLRVETHIDGLDAFRLVSAGLTGENRWTVQFRAADGSQAYTLHLAEDHIQVVTSCGDTEPEIVSQYRLLEITRSAPG